MRSWSFWVFVGVFAAARPVWSSEDATSATKPLESTAAVEPDASPPSSMSVEPTASLEPIGSTAAFEPVWSVPVLHASALMLGMRVSEAFIWPEPFAFSEPQLQEWPSRYERAWTEAPKFNLDRRWFEWDGDPWPINVVGHGLFGSEVFLRMRTCRHNVPVAFAFTAGASALWEYGFEANGVQPSGLDLIATPLLGIALGELRYAGWRLAGQVDHSMWRQWLQAALDPFGEIQRGFGAPC